MKFVREELAARSAATTGLQDIRRLAEAAQFGAPAAHRRAVRHGHRCQPTSSTCCRTSNAAKLKPLKVVVHAGNGGAGLIVDKLEPFLPFEFIKVQHEPDGSFPNGVPNPMLVENHRAPVEALREHRADLRGLLGRRLRPLLPVRRARRASSRATTSSACWPQSSCSAIPAQPIVHDPRLTWNTLDIVESHGGRAVQSKSGHAFIKQRMREVDGVYGGEMSAHHYFRDFSYCDSGMIPWLLVTQLMCESGKTLSELVGERIRLFPASGEINRRVPDAQATIDSVLARYRPAARSEDLHRRAKRRVRCVALQPPHVQHRAADPAERREPRQRVADARTRPRSCSS